LMIVRSEVKKARIEIEKGWDELKDWENIHFKGFEEWKNIQKLNQTN